MPTAFAPSNIALIKYWGKRDAKLNLPNTDSLSISLGDRGTTTTVEFANSRDEYIVNEKPVDPDSTFAKRLKAFLDLRRPKGSFYQVNTINNIPTAAGLASSASGFAALAMALNELHVWQLSMPELSILARLGSGSACRSLWHGFVKWQKGERADGLDSYGVRLKVHWPEFRIGLMLVTLDEKPLSSREAMQRTLETSKRYQTWPRTVQQDLQQVEQALHDKDFALLGQAAEHNALEMHATMEDSHPPVVYSLPETLEVRERVWQARKGGLPVYFTQDAGANLKLLYLVQNEAEVIAQFPTMEIINPLMY